MQARAGALGCLVLAITAASCSTPAAPPTDTTKKPPDAQHAGITTPHGDHTPHHGGMVLMNGEVHYEVVFERGGRHRVWFSNAVREDLPASVASKVRMVVSRPGEPAEPIALAIDDSGESWIASGRPVSAGDVMVKLTYEVRGAPLEIEIPFGVPAPFIAK